MKRGMSLHIEDAASAIVLVGVPAAAMLLGAMLLGFAG